MPMAQYSYGAGGLSGGAFEHVIEPQQAQLMAAQAQAEAQRYATQQQAEIARLQQQADLQKAQLQYEASILPAQQKQERFNTLLSGLFGGGFGFGGGGARAGLPYGGAYPGPNSGQAQAFLNIPGYGAVAPPNIPGSMFAPPPAGGGGFNFGGFGGFGGGGAFDVDRTLPQFNVNPFTESREQQAISASRAANEQQLQTTQRNIANQSAARGYGGDTRQALALQSQADQAARANAWNQQQAIQQQYGMGRAQLEQQQQALIAQRRTDIDKARAAAISPQYGLFSSLLSSAI